MAFPLFLKRFDWILFLPVFFLLTISLLTLYGLSFGGEEVNFFYFSRQALFALVGIGLFFLASFFDYRFWQTMSRPLYIVALLLLLSVVLFGTTIRGTRGWFTFSGQQFQVVELVKFFLLLFLANYFTAWARRFHEWRHILLSGFGSITLVFLVLLQPDLGSALVLFAVWFFLLLIVGIPLRYLVVLGVLFAVVAGIFWNWGFQEYQRDRIRTFFNPSADPLGRGYTVRQSIIAIGSGQWFGRGLGSGSQSQLHFLPEAETDFIFAVIAEELGFLGVTLFFFFWVIFFYRLFFLARFLSDDFAVFFILGVATLFGVEVLITVGVNVGVLPVTGITLPLVSYGGSSLLMHLFMLGVVESAVIHTPRRVLETT